MPLTDDLNEDDPTPPTQDGTMVIAECGGIMSTIRTECPRCFKPIEYSSDELGEVPCPHCGVALVFQDGYAFEFSPKAPPKPEPAPPPASGPTASATEVPTQDEPLTPRQRLKAIRRETCYPNVRALINICAAVGFLISIMFIGMAISGVSGSGGTGLRGDATLLGWVMGIVGMFLTLAVCEALHAVLDIADCAVKGAR